MLKTAAPILDRAWVDEIRGELAWLGGQLGPARDLDVLIPYLREEAGSLDPADRKALAPLFKKLGLQKATARRAVLRALRSERYLALLASIEAAAAGPPPGGTGSLRTEVKNEFKKLRKAMRAVDEEPTDEAIHQARIKGKRARYATELARGRAGQARREAARGREGLPGCGRRAPRRGRRRGTDPGAPARCPRAADGARRGHAHQPSAAAAGGGRASDPQGLAPLRGGGREGVGLSRLVRAAGGVVWRRGPKGLEVLLIHRPRYGDWSFPKGKAKGEAESDEETAVREVEEEVGLRLELGPGAREHEVSRLEGPPEGRALLGDGAPGRGGRRSRETASTRWRWAALGEAAAAADVGS